MQHTHCVYVYSWSYRLCKTPVKSLPPTNQHQVFFTGRMPFLSPNQQCQRVTGHLSEGSFVRNVVVQIPKFDDKPNPNSNPSHNPNPNPSPNSNPNLKPMPIRFGQMTLRTSELSPCQSTERKWVCKCKLYSTPLRSLRAPQLWVLQSSKHDAGFEQRTGVIRNPNADGVCLNMCQSFDVSPYYAFVAISFVAPSVDRQNRKLTFGTFVAIINLCLRLMIRVSVSAACCFAIVM